MKKCVILIPVWKYDLYDYEIISLQRTISLYEKSDIVDIMFLKPKGFKIHDLLSYNNVQYQSDKFLTFAFDEDFFQSSLTYNKLLINKQTYLELIEDYNYILIAQTDAYIFEDQLEYWINKNYNYIGSYEGIIKQSDIDNIFDISNYSIDNKYPVIHMNGGFSLRNIQYCINTLENVNSLCDQIFQSNTYTFGEDMIFSIYSNNQVNALDSIKFGFSHIYFSDVYAINNYNLPFGAHAIHKNAKLFNLVKQYHNKLYN